MVHQWLEAKIRNTFFFFSPRSTARQDASLSGNQVDLFSVNSARNLSISRNVWHYNDVSDITFTTNLPSAHEFIIVRSFKNDSTDKFIEHGSNVYRKYMGAWLFLLPIILASLKARCFTLLESILPSTFLFVISSSYRMSVYMESIRSLLYK